MFIDIKELPHDSGLNIMTRMFRDGPKTLLE